jgi:hypothetical protein
MTIRRLGILQWFGLLAGAVALAVGHTLAFGLTLARCNAGGAHWGLPNDTVEASILGVCALVAALAGAASCWVIARTRNTTYEGDPPLGRIRFLAIAAAIAELFFFAVLMLDLFGNAFPPVCRGA